MARREETTGRIWRCPVCDNVQPEAAVQHSEVICHASFKCRKKPTKMIVEEPATSSQQ